MPITKIHTLTIIKIKVKPIPIQGINCSNNSFATSGCRFICFFIPSIKAV